MSHYMTALAMKQKGLKPATKIVLYWIADHHNGEDGRCFPSLARLCECTEMGKTALTGHLNALEELGLIERVRTKKDDGGWASTSYILHLEEPLVRDANNPCSESATPLVRNANTNLVSNNLVSEPLFGANAAKPAKAKRAVALPEGWVPSEKNIQDAVERGFTTGEINHEADQFSNYHHAKGSTFKSWDAAWRTWLGNARKFSANSKQRNGGGMRSGTVDAFAALSQRLSAGG